MAVMLITYDLNTPGQKYEKLYEAIKAEANGYTHLLDSTWLIVSSSTVSDVSRRIRAAALDDGDHIFVVKVGGANRAGWLPKSKWDWIDKHWNY